jgi:hypothetical protein
MAIEGAKVERVDFGETAGAYARRERKLQPKHKHLRDAVLESGKSFNELMADPFGGYPYLLRAMLKHGQPTITLDQCSDLIDSYADAHDGITGLTESLIKALSLYLHIELTPADDEEVDGERPPQDGPVETAPSNG